MYTTVASSSSSTTAHADYLGRKYFPELDGLRAISVLLVVTAHLYDRGADWSCLAGHRGVVLFFVLSGYLITTLALREEAVRGRVSLAAFYVRRSCRIVPLYYLTLALYCLLIFGLGLSPHQGKSLAEALPYYLLYLQEVPYCILKALGDPTGRDVMFGHSWTLGVEEKFYLLWPLLAFVFWRGNARRRLWGTAALLVPLAVAPIFLSDLGPVPKVVGRLLISYYSLVAGCLLAFLLHDPIWFARLRRLGGAGWTAAVLLVFLAAHFATPWATWGHLLDVVYTLAVTALLVCVLLGEGPLQRGLRCGPLTFVGRLSYGIYLIHMLCLYATYRVVPASELGWPGKVLAFVMTSGLSIAAAWVLKVALEQPCIDLGRRWSRWITERPARKEAPPAADQGGPEPRPAPGVPAFATAQVPGA